MKLILRLAGLALLGMVLLAALGWWQYRHAGAMFDAPLQLAAEQNFAVQPGDGIAQVLGRMHRQGLVASLPAALSVQLRLHRLNKSIQLGVYRLKPGMSASQALGLFNTGKIHHERFVLVEGLTLSEFIPALQQRDDLLNDMPQLVARADYAGFARALGLGESAEGMFLANTYFFVPGSKLSWLLKRAHGALQSELEKLAPACARLPEIAGVKLTPQQQAVLASIIEKETGQASERPRIAAVFLNRLRQKIRLQTDPTVIYGLGDAYDGNLTRTHLRTPGPYNTYRVGGLPPTPISNFGPDALRAVCNPDKDFLHRQMLYFVGKGDGSHHFSASYAEHRKAVQQYQIKRRANYHSAPAQ